MAPHSSTLAWKIPWMEEPGRLQSMGSVRVGHDWATSLSLFTFMHWRRKWQPTPVFLPGESQGRRSLMGCRLWGRTDRAQLKRLSSSSSSSVVSNIQRSYLILIWILKVSIIIHSSQRKKVKNFTQLERWNAQSNTWMLLYPKVTKNRERTNSRHIRNV